MNVIAHSAAAKGAEAPSLIEKLRRAIRVRHPKRQPTVLSREEVAALLSRLEGTVQLIVLPLYGTGMRILECLRLRIQDIDFDLGNITIRNRKGQNDRTTLVPDSCNQRLRDHPIHVLNKSGGRGIISPADTLHAPGEAHP